MKQNIKYYMVGLISVAIFMGAAIAKDPGSWVVGPTFVYHQGLGHFKAELRADVSNSSRPSYQLHITEMQSYWRFLDSAIDYQGNRLRFTSTDTTRGEDIVLRLSRDTIEKSSDGLKINTYGKRGKKLFILPSLYVEGFLTKVDNHTKN